MMTATGHAYLMSVVGRGQRENKKVMAIRDKVISRSIKPLPSGKRPRVTKRVELEIIAVGSLSLAFDEMERSIKFIRKLK